MTAFAYLSKGKLHVRLDGGPSRVMESKFGNEVRQRAREIHQRNSWKTQGRSAMFQRGGGFLWGVNDFDPGSMRIDINGLSRGCGDGELVYSLDTPEVTGIFTVESQGANERRLWHTADYRVSQVCASADQQRIACVMVNRNSSSGIGMMRADGSELTEVTAGDAIDMSPRWVPGEQAIVFQSAGIARDEAGYMRGRGPFSVQKLALEGGDVQALAEDETHDLLAPQLARDGSLYFIRRPYEGVMGKLKWTRAALDLVLFPFRLLYALFQFLNFFSMRYAGKTLATSSGAAQREADMKRMMLWGNVIDASKAERQSGSDIPALVPKSWELVERSPEGTERVLANHVLSFDLTSDGAVLYSDGSGIYRLSSNQKPERLARDSMISQVVAL